jgi:DNA polymerase III alpha subunit (gram-positive type)
MQSRRHFVIYDIETSGLSPEGGAEIVQIAAVKMDYNTYEIDKSSSFEIVLKPQKPDAADPKAIEVIGEDLWQRALSTGVHPKTGLRKFNQYIDSINPSKKFWTAPILVGFNNSGFDNPFTEFWMNHYKVIGQKKNDKPWSYLSIDLLPLLFSVFGRDDMKNQKLDTYLEIMGLSREGGTHDAMEDVLLTAQLFQRYMKFMNFRIRPKIKIDNV